MRHVTDDLGDALARCVKELDRLECIIDNLKKENHELKKRLGRYISIVAEEGLTEQDMISVKTTIAKPILFEYGENAFNWIMKDSREQFRKYTERLVGFR